jgi:hypothetical protein
VSEEAGLDIDFDAELAAVQGSVAGLPAPSPAPVELPTGTIVTSERTVELKGRRFRIADRVGLMPLLKFSAYADMDVQDPRALGAMYAMLRDCIHPGTPACGSCAMCDAGNTTACKTYDPGDWRAFEDWAMESKAESDDLMDVITKTIELVAGRPTPQPGPSSPGRRGTSGTSTARSSAKARRGSRR